MPTLNIHNSYTDLPSYLYSEVTPEPLIDARLVHANQIRLTELGLSCDEETLKALTSGQALPMTPIAQKYTGHQFGYYNPDLGDGRGVQLGQIFDAQQQPWDLHLKGSGQTPYSRRGDGRAVLRSAVREYLIGEALHYQGVATTRCLSLCHSPEPVRRERFEDRASYIRIAKTHIRFGHFEYLAQRQDSSAFEQLIDHVIAQVYPELKALESSDRIESLLLSVVERTAHLIAQWQAVGFCHGVMNTDNMSMAGETFDFGPYAMMDDFSIHFICNHSDTEGRYAYSQQPSIGLWNCQVLANAFALVLPQTREAIIDKASNHYIETYNHAYLQAMGKKFGLSEIQAEDKHFIADSLVLLDQTNEDFHHFFLSLKQLQTEPEQWLKGKFDSKAWRSWAQRYSSKTEDLAQSLTLIEQHTPKLVLRNYMAQEVIDACEQGDYQLLTRMMTWLQTPYTIDADSLEEKAYYLNRPSDCQKGLTLSCSS